MPDNIYYYKDKRLDINYTVSKNDIAIKLSVVVPKFILGFP